MHQGRNQPRLKVSTLFLITLLVSLVFYVFYFQYRDIYNNREDIEGRCLSELANVKYQLDNVLEYKKTMDTVINEIQQECFIQKQSLKEFSNSYLLMKQHLEICEMQTEDLEVECKELKAKLQNSNTELAVCKKAPG